MEIREERKENVFIIRVNGRIDSVTAKQFETSFLQLIDNGDKLFLVDLSACDFINSTGLRVLLLAAKRLTAAEGRIVIAGVNAYIKEVFDIAGFSAIFNIYPTEEVAIQSL